MEKEFTYRFNPYIYVFWANIWIQSEDWCGNKINLNNFSWYIQNGLNTYWILCFSFVNVCANVQYCEKAIGTPYPLFQQCHNVSVCLSLSLVSQVESWLQLTGFSTKKNCCQQWWRDDAIDRLLLPLKVPLRQIGAEFAPSIMNRATRNIQHVLGVPSSLCLVHRLVSQQCLF